MLNSEVVKQLNLHKKAVNSASLTFSRVDYIKVEEDSPSEQEDNLLEVLVAPLTSVAWSAEMITSMLKNNKIIIRSSQSN